MRKQNGLLAMVLGLLMSVFLAAGMANAFQPEATVVFTFDDGRLNGAPVAFPIMEKYGFPGVCYITSGFVGQDWVMGWNEIKKFQAEGWEIGSHTRTHPSLISLSDQQLTDELLGSRQDLEAQGIKVSSFASPFGDYDSRVLVVVAKYYQSHRTAWPAGSNSWPYNNFALLTREVTNLTTPQEVGKWIDEAIGGGQLLILLFHALVNGVAEPYQYNVDDFKELVDVVAESGIQVMTISEALGLEPPEPKPTNLVKNPSFEDFVGGYLDGWYTNDSRYVKVLTDDLGNFVRIIGGKGERYISSLEIPVKAGKEYKLSFYQWIDRYRYGGAAVWIDEFAVSGKWVSGQWLGGTYRNFVGTIEYSYRAPARVDSVSVVLYTEAGSKLAAYFDDVSLIQK